MDSERYSIVSDYLGRPVQAFDDSGELVWQTEYDIYGGLRHLEGEKGFIPFRQLGQYEDEEVGLYYNRFRYYDPNAGNYLNQDPIGLAGGNPTFYGYVQNVNSLVDRFGLYSDIKPTGDGHHLFPRSIGDNLGIRDTIENVKWYPNISENTAVLHQELHAKLSEEGIPYHGSKYTGTLDEALDSMDNAYKNFNTKGYLMIDGEKFKNLTPSEAMQKVREHIKNKHH